MSLKSVSYYPIGGRETMCVEHHPWWARLLGRPAVARTYWRYKRGHLWYHSSTPVSRRFGAKLTDLRDGWEHDHALGWFRFD